MHHPPQQSSPFTHAPLQHNNNHNQPPKGQPSSHYPGYQYQYPYGHYTGYSQPQPAAEKSAAPAAASAPTLAADHTAPTKAGEEKDDGDAWEAAQHILQAINFSNLASGSPSADRPGSPSGADLSPSVADDLHAALAALTNAAAAAAAAEAQVEAPRTSLTDDERASLQAQLALLAAQLTAIAEGEDEEDEEELQAQAVSAQPEPPHLALVAQPAPAPAHTPAPDPVPPPAKTVELPPPPIAAYSGAHLVLDINAFPEVFESSTPVSATANASAAQTDVDVDELAGESSDDDDDMEDVVVPLQGHGALRT